MSADPFAIIKGEMAGRVRAFDWTTTPLGPIAGWPQSLRTAVGMVLLSPVPIVMLWGEDGIMIYNDGYSVFAGDRHPSLLGSKVREGWPEVADFNDNIMKVGLAGGTLAYRDFVLHLNRTGTFEPVWLDLDYSPILDESGKPAGVMAIVIEITERKRADEAMRRSEERLRLATENAGVGLWDIDADGGIDFSYSRRSSSFVMDRDNRVPMTHLLSRLHPEDAPRLEATYNAARDPARRAMMDVEYRVLPEGDSPLRWVKIRGRGVFDADGKLLRIAGTALDITRERETQEALTRSEEQLRLATENAEIGMWDMDVVNNVNYSTPHVKALFGIPPEDNPRSEDFFALVHKDDVARVEAAYAGAFDPQKRATYDVQYRVIGRDDGVTRWIHAKGRGVFDANGNCLRVTGTAIDVTLEREIAEALRRSEEQLRLATEYADVGLWDIDLINDIVYWPPRVNAMFGIAPDVTVTMKDFRARIHPDDRRKTIERILEACDPDKRTFYDAEYRIVRKNDGEVRWMAAKGRAIFDDAGVCVRMLGVILDITGRKAMEEQARESEARFRTLFESIDDGFCIIEAIEAPDGGIADFRYIEENPALAKRSGITGALGHTIREMLPTEADGWIEILAKVLTSGEALRFERFLETTERLLELYVLRVEPRERNQVAVLFQDITDRRASELRLHELNETLEKRVIERTAALERSQAALQQAQKMEAIGNLTGGIAHDFNNLLQGLTGSLDLIRRAPEKTERVRHWAEAGLQAAERGAKLTAQLLAFSRSQKMELKPLDLSALLEGMRDLLGRTLGPTVRVTLDLTNDAASVLGDETQLEMAVLNLAINARDAMGGSGALSIQTRPCHLTGDAELAVGDYIELAITDTGAGMPADVIARAFDPFFTTKGVGKGTGLGLSQVYGMARQAGGIARIRSTAGQGTTVSIFLRATSEGATQDVRAEQRDDLDMAAPATILVVDDDAGVRQFLTDSLDSFGYAVLEAENGETGLQMLARAAPDLMLVDYAMPGMTGAEVARRARETHPNIPIVFASGYAETAALENVLDDNTLILRKPFRLGDLQDAVAKALRR